MTDKDTADNARFDPPAGVAETLAPGIRRILAPNPSPMTFRGTNTYIIGTDDLAVIDPGPDDADHLRAISTAIGDPGRLRYILITHSHRDHSLLAPALSAATAAPVLAFGRSDSGRSPVMQALARDGLAGGGEGADVTFTPDRTLDDGARLPLGPDQIEAIHTPGHMGNHLAFAYRGALFCGDLAMGWASSLISPPDGDLEAFFATCARLKKRPEPVFYPGHGAPLEDPSARLAWLVSHRKSREAQIIEALSEGPADLHDLTRRVYTDVNPALFPAASRNVLAHLIELHGREKVRATPCLSANACFQLG